MSERPIRCLRIPPRPLARPVIRRRRHRCKHLQAPSAFAHVLSAAAFISRTAPLRIAFFELSPEPDRIIDELLQPGGVAALRSLGLGTSLDSIDVVLDAGETVHTPYPSRAQGRSFHHGRFIQKLRTHAKAAPGVDVIEATATDLIEPHPCARREDTG